MLVPRADQEMLLAELGSDDAGPVAFSLALFPRVFREGDGAAQITAVYAAFSSNDLALVRVPPAHRFVAHAAHHHRSPSSSCASISQRTATRRLRCCWRRSCRGACCGLLWWVVRCTGGDLEGDMCVSPQCGRELSELGANQRQGGWRPQYVVEERG